jgi:outer membrane receptor protein involved in Fe transport
MKILYAGPALLACSMALADATGPAEKTLAPVVVESSRANPSGAAESATEGTVTARQLANRPLQRTGALLEAVPGVIVTQHSGDGKANQYFARGFNLDHGTDFRTTVLGMPVNMPSHAHGQGYSDLNFIIPELVSTIQYKKGPYYAEEGDFASAGAASFEYFRSLDQGLLSLEAGQYRYRRAVVANSSAVGPGTLLYAVEGAGQDGPWDTPQRYKRFNGVLSYSLKNGADEMRVTAMALDSSWNSTDQVPRRALASGQVSRFGAIDPTDGGDTARYSLSADWLGRYADGSAKVNAYLVKSRLDLYSNFTYALDDALNGDQFNQSERRLIGGLNAQRSWLHALAGLDMETTVGFQLRADRLSPVALYATAAQQRLSTTRREEVTERSAGIFASNTTRWLPWFRTVAGIRADRYDFDVSSNNPANSGRVDATITSPKLAAVFSPTANSEVYLNWGRGFHSNDARGVTGTVDPKTGSSRDADGEPVQRATPLVRTTGREIGVRYSGLVPGLQTTLSVWRLGLDSELVFVGDAGTTEASRPSRRSGVELANYYVPAPGWIIDLDLAWSRARFSDADPAGRYIPGAVNRTAALGISGEQGRWSGGMRLRYFGGRPLVEDNTVRSPSSTLVNAKLAYALTRDVKVSVEMLNLFDRRVSDIDYYYTSRLATEPEAVNDIHTHPAEPRSLRLGLVMKF